MGHPETNQLECRTVGSCCDAPVAAGKVDCTSQLVMLGWGPGRCWKPRPAWEPAGVLCRGPVTLLRALRISCILNVYLLLGTSAYSLPTRDQYQAYTHVNVLDHPGDQVIKAARRFGRKTVLEIMLRCNPRTSFFIEGHSWCQTHVEKKRTGP